MPSLRDLMIQKVKEQEESKKAEIKNSNAVIPKRIKIKPKKDSTPKKISKLSMDEVRAYYIVICKRTPKHDSTHTKEVLINEIINVLKSSI